MGLMTKNHRLQGEYWKSSRLKKLNRKYFMYVKRTNRLIFNITRTAVTVA